MTDNGFMSLQKRDLQLFFKRLRKKYEKSKNKPIIRYYACGEYGGNTNRPHYHAIVFNVDPQMVMESWTFGSCHFGEVTEASVGYTLKYISKASQVPLHQRDDRCREFSLMSKKMGLSFVTPEMVQWYRDDWLNRMYLPLKDGKRISIPRYYYRFFFTPAERQAIGQFIQDQQFIQFQRKTFDEQLAFQKENDSIRNQLLDRSKRDSRIQTVL